MQIVRDLAGYSYGRSDQVRRAMSKKKADVMEKEKNYFIYGNEEIGVEGCIKRGIPEEVAIKIFDDMTDFAKYAFNKSHAAAYAVVSYQTAYLKCHYPVDFMAALMTSFMEHTGKITEYIMNCRKWELKFCHRILTRESIVLRRMKEISAMDLLLSRESADRLLMKLSQSASLAADTAR